MRLCLVQAQIGFDLDKNWWHFIGMSELVEIKTAAVKPAGSEQGFSSRREFLALPLAKRREILQTQALKARKIYTQSREWREWESADLTSSPQE